MSEKITDVIKETKNRTIEDHVVVLTCCEIMVSQNKNKKSEISPELGYVSIKIERLSKYNFSPSSFLSFLIDWPFRSLF